MPGLASGGRSVRAAAKNDGLVYPAMPAFGTTRTTRTTLYITNGALLNGTPGIAAFPEQPARQRHFGPATPKRVPT